ncbi:MAG: glycosyltransferase family 2 protein [Gallionella sp.]|nr:glycosyltransferase family 2 protein [Gallionella sp.]
MSDLSECKSIPEISVVIPIYNEQENIPELYNRLTGVLDTLCERERFARNEYEIILVDDGSKDSSWKLIEEIHSNDNRLKGLKFARNFGHHFAITAGMDFAKGKAIVMLDGDLQDPPEEIARLYDKYKEGYDIVYGIRKNRQDPPLKKALSFMFWWSINKVSDIDMPVNQTMLRILSRVMVDSLKEMREYSRFVHGMMAWVGFKATQIEVLHDPRKKGQSKYNLGSQIRLALHAITSFSIFPLRLATYLGLATSMLSFLVGVFYVYRKIFYDFPVSGWASIMVAVFFMGGVQLLMLGTFGEYLGKIYRQSQQRPLYILKEILN